MPDDPPRQRRERMYQKIITQDPRPTLFNVTSLH